METKMNDEVASIFQQRRNLCSDSPAARKRQLFTDNPQQVNLHKNDRPKKETIWRPYLNDENTTEEDQCNRASPPLLYNIGDQKNFVFRPVGYPDFGHNNLHHCPDPYYTLRKTPDFALQDRRTPDSMTSSRCSSEMSYSPSSSIGSIDDVKMSPKQRKKRNGKNFNFLKTSVI